jgi:tetratricopeptide (TPR) repeat protein
MSLTIAAVVILGCVLGAVYGRALSAPFIYDDPTCIANNPSIVRLWPLVGDAEHPGPLNPPKDLPTSGRPLVNLSLALNYQFGGLDSTGYHLFNLIVHLLAALLLGLIVRRTLRLEFFDGRFTTASGLLAFLVALLWAVHPLQTETVIYVTQRTELMVGLFYLATLYGSLRYWDAPGLREKTIWLILTTLACLAGMASKEVMVTAPVLVLLFQRTFITGSFRQALRQSLPLYVGLALGCLLLLALNYNSPRAASAGFNQEIAPLSWWFTQSKVLWLYLKLVVWPWPLLIHYQLPYLDSFSAAWPWLLITALLIVATIVLLWRRQAAGFVGAWMLLILSPTLIVPIVTEVAAERRMYLPLAALITLAVTGGYRLVQQAWAEASATTLRSATNRPGPFAAIATVAAALALTWSLVDIHRLDAFHDAFTLWQDTINNEPDNALAYCNLGDAYIKADRRQEALSCYQHALQLNPNYVNAYNNLAYTLVVLGKPQEAVKYFREAILRKPNDAEMQYNLACALKLSGQLPEAVKFFQQALSLKPDFPEAYFNLAMIDAAANQSADALAAAQKAIALARAQRKTALAEQIERWLTNYRAR